MATTVLGGWQLDRMMPRYAAVTEQMLRAVADSVAGAAAMLSGGDKGWR